MSFFFWTAGIPIATLVLAAVLVLSTSPDNPIAVGAAVIAFVWLFATARMRKLYWSSRVRSRANYDGRRARSQSVD